MFSGLDWRKKGERRVGRLAAGSLATNARMVCFWG